MRKIPRVTNMGKEKVTQGLLSSESENVALRLENIVKVYGSGNTAVHALKGISLNFRKSEFVSVLGQSGCGKTTMLNIIGGLDRYTSGDMLINDKSTKDFKDRDWDTYRNHSIGFVFQSYNLIPHQTVLQNVELALALSGVSRHERRERAKQALISVGLDTQFNKKPGEMSGGQMQRVAIARALVNNPDIILADEPTGALDSETSVQVMEILKQVSKDRLVIMVTHNPDLAEKYSTRIVRMLDGEIVEDTNPLIAEKPLPVIEETAIGSGKPKKLKKAKKTKKPTMSFWTSFSLSLKNLFTKKGRTILTSFAGSIGIIGIALIYAVSQGMTSYVNHVQETTLASYPLTLQSTTMDLTSLMESFMDVGKNDNEHERDKIYKQAIITDLVNALAKTGTAQNDLKSFKTYLENQVSTEGTELNKSVSGIQYEYDMELDIYTENVDGDVIKSDTNELMSEMIGKFMLGLSTNGGNTSSGSTNSSPTTSMMSSMMMGGGMWQELLPALDGSPINDMLKDQYTVVYGEWPTEYNEIVLVVNKNNELDDLTLYALGLLSKTEIDAIIDSAVNGEELPETERSWTYEEICTTNGSDGLTFRTILPCDRYTRVGDVFVDLGATQTGINELFRNDEKTIPLKVTGIIRPSDDTDSPILSSGIGYTNKLTEYAIDRAENSDVVKTQKLPENVNIDVLTGLPFKTMTGVLTKEEKKVAFEDYVNGLTSVEARANVYTDIQCIIPQDVLMQNTQSILGGLYPIPYDEAVYKENLINFIAKALAVEMDVDELAVKALFEEAEISDLMQTATPIAALQTSRQYDKDMREYLDNNMPNSQDRADQLAIDMASYTLDQFDVYYDNVMKFSDSTYENNLLLLGNVDKNSPSSIYIYTDSFANKDIIKSEIARYNEINKDDETKRIQYTDYVGLIMSSVTTIINAITYVLIAFVSVSLIVSSIMIGVITLISVQERTKEIGILRAIGASKRNVSSMFNAETLIIGFSSGMFGVLFTYLICIPINIILHVLTGINTLSAVLPPLVAVILVGISMLLTLISGIIPSRSAAKKDPVVALRSE